MKKLLLLLVIALPLSVFAQNIDTAFVRNFSMKGKEWMYAIGAIKSYPDSLYNKRFKKLSDKVAVAISAVPGNRSVKLEADIVIDTVYMNFAHDFWKVFVQMPYFYVQTTMGTNAATKLNQINHPLFTNFKLVYNTNVQRDCEAIISKGIWETFERNQ